MLAAFVFVHQELLTGKVANIPLRTQRKAFFWRLFVPLHVVFAPFAGFLRDLCGSGSVISATNPAYFLCDLPPEN
jgi:hypothetical protein